MSRTPTAEQQAIVDATRTGANLVIEAGAGTGKTTTLRQLAEADPDRQGLYVAYNRAIADDARADFPRSVQCSTAHSLAFRAVGRQYKHRLNGPRQPARESARILGIRDPLPIDAERTVMPEQLTRLVMDTVRRFCNSADTEIGVRHLPGIAGLDDREAAAALRNAVMPYARKAWADLSSTDGRLKFQHDHYLKLWQLSRPRLPWDYVLLDEAQDASPVIADVVERQDHAQRILVGDRCQAIYGWRGAIDAMQRFGADRRLELSQSFRFGAAVADEANKWLSILDSPLRLSGYDRINSAVDRVDEPDAVLCRSNSEAIAQIMGASARGRRAALVGGGQDIRRMAEAAVTLKAGAGTNHPELFAFRDWGEVQDYVAQDAGGSDLRTFVRLIDSYGPDTVIATVDQLAPENRADVVVSTAHKAKGRQWGTLRIAGDFREPRPDDDGNPQPIDPADAMLAYVAVTRAQYVLDRRGLAWVDNYLPEPSKPAGELVGA